jgi:GNAT superfamily N-acetyltransferase
MTALRPRPDLDQLRRQARDLLKAAQAGDSDALSLLRRAGARTTLAGAQHALARDYGFASWPKLKVAVETRVARRPSFIIRHVASPAELEALWRTVWGILGRPEPPDRTHWGVFERFEEQRSQMLVVHHEGAIVGGTIAMHLIAIESWARGIGLGRRLLQAAEGEAAASGLQLATYADPACKGFYLKLGYIDGGKGPSRLHMSKGVPLSPRLVELRTRRWRDQLGDLRRGVVVTPDPATGAIPPLPW